MVDFPFDPWVPWKWMGWTKL